MGPSSWMHQADTGHASDGGVDTLVVQPGQLPENILSHPNNLYVANPLVE